MEDIVRNEILVLTSSWEVKEGRKSSDGSLLILLSFDLLQRDSLLTAPASLVLCIWNKKEVLRQEKGKKLPYQQKENQWRKVYEAKNFVQEDKNKGRKAAYPETSCLFFSLPFSFLLVSLLLLCEHRVLLPTSSLWCSSSISQTLTTSRLNIRRVVYNSVRKRRVKKGNLQKVRKRITWVTQCFADFFWLLLCLWPNIGSWVKACLWPAFFLWIISSKKRLSVFISFRSTIDSLIHPTLVFSRGVIHSMRNSSSSQPLSSSDFLSFFAKSSLFFCFILVFFHSLLDS